MCLLVLRHRFGDTYDIIGQGLLNNDCSFCGSPKGELGVLCECSESSIHDILEAQVELYFSGEDALVLVGLGQDIMNTAQDPGARVVTLTTKVSLASQGAARMTMIRQLNKVPVHR